MTADALAPDDPRHGTNYAYSGRGCRCDRCRQGQRERHALRKAKGLAPDDPRHGTYAGYCASCRCDPCREAMLKKDAEYRRREGIPSQEAMKATLAHGTAGMYKIRGCRCDECVAWNREYYKAYNARQRGKRVKPKPLTKIERVVSVLKRGGAIEGEVLDVRGLTTDDLRIINECFADVDVKP